MKTKLKSLWNNFKSFLLQWGVEIFSVATIRRWNLVNPFMTNLFSLIILLHQQHEFISFTIIILLFIPFVEFYGMNKKPFNKNGVHHSQYLLFSNPKECSKNIIYWQIILPYIELIQTIILLRIVILEYKIFI